MAKPRKNSPSTPLQPFPREKVRPATASPWPNREKTRPARPKTPKASHFSRAGRTFSRFQRRTTEQGDFSPATTPLNTHHRDTTTHPPPQPVQNSPHNTRHKAQPVQNSPNNTHNQRKLAISRQQGELFPVPNTAPPSRENFLPQQHHSIPITGTPPPQPAQNPPSNAADNALSRGTSQHAVQNSPSTPTSKPNRYKTLPTTPATRHNRYKTLPARPKTTKTGHFSPARRIISRSQRDTTEQGEFSPATTPLNTHHRDTTTHPPPQPVQNSPHNTRHKAQPVQNSPSTPTINENWPFLASRENYFPFPTPHHRAGRIFSRNNTILVSISTQLTGWSPLSPRHQTNAPLSSALCGLLAAHHDAAPERAGTGRRLADWKWPRHPQASSLHPTTRTNVSDVRPPSSTG